LAPGARFCFACGKPVNVTAPSITPGPVRLAVTPISDASVPPLTPTHAAPRAQPGGNAITWPFHQPSWLASLWILLVGWFFLPLPMTISFGWLMDAAARQARHDPERLPKARNLFRMYRDGLTFWLALAAYFVVPLMIFTWIFAKVEASIVEEINAWIMGAILNPIIPAINFLRGIFSVILAVSSLGTAPPLQPIALYPHETFANEVTKLATEYFSLLAIYAICFIIAYLLFLAGTIHFAVTRRIGDYFRIFKNLGLVVAHLYRFLWLVLLLALLNFAIGWITPTGLVGFVLSVTFGVWITADLLGGLAAKLCDLKAVE
jgi:hypothetical protein